MADFDIKIKYHPGSKNIVADALSHRVDLHVSSILTTTTVHNNLVDEVLLYAKDDVEYQHHVNLINNSMHSDPTYSIIHGMLYKGDCLYIPEDALL